LVIIYINIHELTLEDLVGAVKTKLKISAIEKLFLPPFYGLGKLLLIPPFTSSKRTKIDINSRLISDTSFSWAKSGKSFFSTPFYGLQKLPYSYMGFKKCNNLANCGRN